MTLLSGIHTTCEVCTVNATQRWTGSKSVTYRRSTAYPPRTRCIFAANTWQICRFKYGRTCPRSAQLSESARIKSSSIWADSVHVVHAACECVYTNQCDRLGRIRSRSAHTTRCWADTNKLRM